VGNLGNFLLSRITCNICHDYNTGICSYVVCDNFGADIDAGICSNAVWGDDFDDNKRGFDYTCDNDALGDNVDSCGNAPFANNDEDAVDGYSDNTRIWSV
jgi:hypothetical protein